MNLIKNNYLFFGKKNIPKIALNNFKYTLKKNDDNNLQLLHMRYIFIKKFLNKNNKINYPNIINFNTNINNTLNFYKNPLNYSIVLSNFYKCIKTIKIFNI